MKNNIFDLSGQVALVAGASSGLGLQFAKAMANAGADLAMALANCSPRPEEAPATRATWPERSKMLFFILMHSSF